jgi:cystathionine beta-lyase
MRLFRLGYSWGGFESLVVPVRPDPARTVMEPPQGTLLRLHAGLEDPDDLLADLNSAFSILS